ncbi:MAG: hypothetical protein C0485_16550 [Pirellula sp.]|nr:hypothetical protein [Pirellula sp.]
MAMTNDGRDPSGRFAPGCSGGPGRPSRSTEHAYVRVTIAGVTPERWAKIVERAAVDAEAGDPTARAWLTRILCGITPPTPKELAVMEAAGQSIDAMVEKGAAERRWLLRATDGLCEA